MAIFRVTSAARQHIVQRAVERFFGGDTTRTQEAEGLLDAALSALRAHTPDDWRFTRHPSAHFFISLVRPRCGASNGFSREAQLKLLGGTYRMSHHGRELEQRLRRYVKKMSASTDPGANLAELRAMAALYLQDLQEPNAEIVHELKTVYSPASDIAQRRISKQKRLEDFRHTAILRSLKTPKIHAALPNALICAEEAAPAGLTLWVRQGDYWSAPRLKTALSVYALFCRLTRSGPALDTGQIWRFDNQGNIRRQGPAELRALLGCGWDKPEGYRSESYWVLPTRLDALWLHYDYLAREMAHRLTAADIVSLNTILWIYELAMAEAGLAPHPAWATKPDVS